MSLEIVTSNSEGVSIKGDSILCDGVEINHIQETDNRPLLLSELIGRLKYRNWGYPMMKIYENGTYYGCDSIEMDIDLSLPRIPKESRRFPITTSKINEIMQENITTLYSSSKVIVDFLNESIAVDLLENDEYTNTINLVDVERRLGYSNISCKVDLTVRYTISGEVRCRDLTFKAFSIGEDGEIKRDDFISPLGDDIMVEYVDGVVRVIPSSHEVDECIIGNCVITYGQC